MAADPRAVSALPDEVKKNLKSIVLELRHLFEGDLGLGLKRLGIDAETGKVTPAGDPALHYLTAEEREARSSLDAVLAKEAAMTKDVPEAVRALLREAAYTHLNRLIGLKCLELRGHLAIDGERTEIVTQRSDYGDLSKYLWTLRSRDARLLGDPELLWREGLLRACTAASAELGVLFDPEDPYAQVWPSHKALAQAVRTLAELPESAFRTDELLGWVYQYFQSEEKDRVFAEVRTKKKKIAWADIVPVTQLYTERYMVDFLLQNSIGARWMEMYPDSRAKEAWLYYVEPATPHAREPRAVKEWTLLDPCCGSGHFLVVAFDLLVQLYAEERALAEQGLIPADWAVHEAEVARTILARNLHGIDIDPRAVQLSALALYLKAKELGLDDTPQMHLVIADCVLQRGEHFQALLDTYEGDVPAVEAIEAIWSALEHVRDLGSLVRIEEEVEAAVAIARKRSAGSFGELTDWVAYKAELIARLKGALAAETSSRDHRQRVFGAEAEKGLGLFELLSTRYDVVFTNPPYMGSRHMGSVLKSHLASFYEAGKRDAATAFLLRCTELCTHDGTVGMVLQQAWMFYRAYSDLRASANGKATSSQGNAGERGLLNTTSITSIGHLGTGAFSEVAGEVVNVVLLTLRAAEPAAHHRMAAIRAVSAPNPRAKADLLKMCSGDETHPARFSVEQAMFLSIPQAPIAYWVPLHLLELLKAATTVASIGGVKQGLATGDNAQFVRCFWEVPDVNRWAPYAKGGGFCRWYGLTQFCVDWLDSGAAIKGFRDSAGHHLSAVRNESTYRQSGVTYSLMAGGSLGLRLLDDSLYDVASMSIFPTPGQPWNRFALMAALNTHLLSYLARLISQDIKFNTSYVSRLPLPNPAAAEVLAEVGRICVGFVRSLVATDALDRAFRECPLSAVTESSRQAVIALLHSHEGFAETVVQDGFDLSADEFEAVRVETGTPVGWHPIVESLDAIPVLPAGLPRPSRGLLDHITQHRRIAPTDNDLARLKARLRTLYLAGPGADVKVDQRDDVDGGEEVAPLGKSIHIPPQTFLEELSQKLEIHPVSVFCLLEEMRETEGVVCPPETKREAEDWLSVKLLRLLGHRWPMQDRYEEEEGKQFLDSAWVDPDGIIALTAGMGEETLSERYRRFLDAEYGPDHGLEVEAELAHALGWKPGTEWGKQKPTSLRDWFQRDFFRRHVSQFKRRPIAWHLKSPKGIVHVLVYYHAFNRDRLALLRAGYLGSLRQELSGKLAAATDQGYDDRVNLERIDKLEEQLADLRAFDDKLAQLQEGRAREARIWCPWKMPEEQPQGWDPDIDDGVRVNIAPLQRLGLLAADVLNKKDLNSLLAPEARE